MSFALLKSACLHVSPYFHFPGSLFGITPKGLTNTSGITSIQNGPNSEGSLSYYKWSSPKAVPPDHLRQNNWSPLHAADCGPFAIAFAAALAYGEQPGHYPFNQNKVRQHQLKSLREGEMTPLPLKKNRRNGR